MKFAEVDPVGTMTLAGTMAQALFEDRATVTFEVAVKLNVTVPVVVPVVEPPP